jgi:hypothetical protein
LYKFGGESLGRGLHSGGSVGQTSDRHSEGESEGGVEPSAVLREQREVLRKKLRLLLEGRLREARSSKIEFRTWPDLKYVYGKAPDYIKTAARKAFEAVILSWFLGEETLAHREGGSPSVFNININMNENKASARAESNITLPPELVRALGELEKLLDFIAYKSQYPANVRHKAALGLSALKSLREYMGSN